MLIIFAPSCSGSCNGFTPRLIFMARDRRVMCRLILTLYRLD